MMNFVARMLLRNLGFLDGAKTWSGISGLVLGGLLYLGQKNGIAPTEVDGNFGLALDWLNTILFQGGGLLTTLGVGHKMGKQ